MKQITEEQKRILDQPLPDKAVTPHPTKQYLSNIKSIYVTERLNTVFGVGSWRVKSELVEKKDKMVVVKTFFVIPEYGIYYECYGGNDNADLGDAYKGAVTDAITKIGSWLGIGAHVWKNEKQQEKQSQAKRTAKATTATKQEPAIHETKQPDIKGITTLTLEQMRAINGYNDTGIVSNDFINAVESCTDKKQLQDINNLISPARKTADGKVEDTYIKDLLNNKYNALK